MLGTQTHVYYVYASTQPAPLFFGNTNVFYGYSYNLAQNILLLLCVWPHSCFFTSFTCSSLVLHIFCWATFGTTGHVSTETIEKYIKEQQTEWKRIQNNILK